jgi:hypothetical protein
MNIQERERKMNKGSLTIALVLLAGWIITDFVIPRSTLANITAVFESPEDGHPVSGIAVIRGWAFASASSSVDTVELFIDGVRAFDIPCCSERADVAAAYPAEPYALQSGFGITFNYGLLPPGSHVVSVRVTDTTGAFLRLDHTVNVVTAVGFEFLDRFDLACAVVFLEGEDVVISGVRVRDKATHQEETTDVRFRWFQGSQSLGMTGMMTQGGQAATREVTGTVAEEGGAGGTTQTFTIRAQGTDGSVHATLMDPATGGFHMFLPVGTSHLIDFTAHMGPSMTEEFRGVMVFPCSAGLMDQFPVGSGQNPITLGMVSVHADRRFAEPTHNPLNFSDTDNDGAPDSTDPDFHCDTVNDGNHDGYYDDDLDRDGHHDDDLNHDGFHDGDMDHDGHPDGMEPRGHPGAGMR